MIFIQNVVHSETEVEPFEVYSDIRSELGHYRLYESVGLVPPDTSYGTAVRIDGQSAYHIAAEREEIAYAGVDRVLGRVRDAVAAVVVVAIVVFRETGVRVAVGSGCTESASVV